MNKRLLFSLVTLLWLFLGMAQGESESPVLIRTDFEGASLGKVEAMGADHFRLHVEGQSNELGRNRQATWYFFRMDHVRGRKLTLTLTDFEGEYNGKPACAMNGELRPVYSLDGEQWTHFEAMEWDAQAKEATVRLNPENDTIFVAHVPPYPFSRLNGLIQKIASEEFVLDEVIGSTCQGRELHVLTVSNPAIGDSEKKCVWLQARQHAWEAGTSWVMEGALRFIVSQDPEAIRLRDRVLFKFTPMVDPDGCASGKVRFNAFGYDVNRHWDVVDLRSKTALSRMPEIWYVKKAVSQFHFAQHRIDLMLNMHNTETAEYLESCVDEEVASTPLIRLFASLSEGDGFVPSRRLAFVAASGGTANDLWWSHRIPIALMELRISDSQKRRGHYPTTSDRLRFGEELIRAMAKAVLEP